MGLREVPPSSRYHSSGVVREPVEPHVGLSQPSHRSILELLVVLSTCLSAKRSLSSLRHFLRPRVQRWVKDGLRFVNYVQRSESPLLSAVVWISCQTVSIDFYEKTLPFLFWVVNPWLASHLILLLGLCVYFGNFLKDLVCAPRPAEVLSSTEGAPVIKALASNGDAHTSASAKEYGLPSSHTMNSLVFSGFLAHYLVDKKIASGWLLYPLVAAWVVWIGLARIYMGLHTAVDVFAGICAGLLLTYIWISFADLDSMGRLYSQVCICGLVLWLHPKPLVHTPTFTWTVTFAGVCCGFALGLQGIAPPDASPLPHIEAGSWYMLRLVAAASWRVVVGTILVLAAQLTVKYVAFWALGELFTWVPLDVRRTWQPPVHNCVDKDVSQDGIPMNERGQAWDVSLGARFLSYAALAWAVTAAPAVFRSLQSVAHLHS